MVEKKIVVVRRDGKIYEQTQRVFDTCEEYFNHVSNPETDELSAMRNKVRRVERGLNELNRSREYDDYEDVRRDIRKLLKYSDLLDEF